MADNADNQPLLEEDFSTENRRLRGIIQFFIAAQMSDGLMAGFAPPGITEGILERALDTVVADGVMKVETFRLLEEILKPWRGKTEAEAG